MRWLGYVLLVLSCAGCSGLLANAPTFLPSLERCKSVSYQREGQIAELTLRDCTVPTGELAR